MSNPPHELVFGVELGPLNSNRLVLFEDNGREKLEEIKKKELKLISSPYIIYKILIKSL